MDFAAHEKFCTEEQEAPVEAREHSEFICKTGGFPSTFRTRQQCWPDFEKNQREANILTGKLEFLLKGFKLQDPVIDLDQKI